MTEGDRLTLTLTVRSRAGDRLFEFRGPRSVSIGRGLECDVPVAEPRASRRHCTIDLGPGGASVKDLASTNGTFVNGERVRLQALRSGDVVVVGDTELDVVLESGPATAKVASPSATRALPESVDPASLELPGYEVRGCIGLGATALVLEAVAPNGEVVAVKVLLAGSEADDRQRFARATTVWRRLNHPNVVRVVGDGVAGARPYVVMELVRGETLHARLVRERRLPVAEVLRLARQVALGLEHARGLGVVHRDVKPANIMLQADGLAKLTDFGLAKPVAETPQVEVTHAGVVLGTLAYMSPEQLESSATVDHRSDIYSLGATLYHALSGLPVFQACSTDELCARVQSDLPRPLAAANPDVPIMISRLVMRCLEKDPARRFQRAQEVARLIETLASPATTETTG